MEEKVVLQNLRHYLLNYTQCIEWSTEILVGIPPFSVFKCNICMATLTMQLGVVVAAHLHASINHQYFHTHFCLLFFVSFFRLYPVICWSLSGKVTRNVWLMGEYSGLNRPEFFKLFIVFYVIVPLMVCILPTYVCVSIKLYCLFDMHLISLYIIFSFRYLITCAAKFLEEECLSQNEEEDEHLLPYPISSQL